MFVKPDFMQHHIKIKNVRLQLIGRSPKEAYAALINVLSGKGTWESNPYVFVYDFELSDLSVDPHEEIG